MLSGAPPVAGDLSGLSVLHGRMLEGIDLAGNCSDAENDPLTIEIVDQPAYGSVGYNPVTGLYAYSSYLGEHLGPVSFTYRAFDGDSYSNLATVSITVTNTTPTAGNLGPLSVHHGGSLTDLDLLGNTSDADQDALTAEIVQYPSHGYLDYDSGSETWSYYSDADYVGSDSFTYQVFDGDAYSNVATVSFTVTNTAPTTNNAGVFSLHHSDSLTGIDLLAFASDAGGDPLNVEIVQEPMHGGVWQNFTTGLWEYYPYGGYAGPDSFTFRAFDGVAYSNVATMSLDLTNTAPIANHLGAYTVEEGGWLSGLDLLANAYDPDGDPLSVEIVQEPTYGSVWQNATTSLWEYYPYGGHVGPDTFTYRAHDGVAYSNVATVSMYLLGGEGYEAYNAYLMEVVEANASYASAVASAKAGYDDAVTAAHAEAASEASAAYALYESTVASAHQTYVAAEEPAYATLTEAVDQVYAVAGAALDEADGEYANALADAETAYQAALSAADQTYQAAVDPYQQARDQAYANYLANPEDPEAQAAYEQAEQDLANAIAQAAPVRDAAHADALADYEVAAADAQDTLDAARAIVQQELQSDEEAAWAAYAAVANPARSALVSAEAAAWITYMDSVATAQADLDVAVGNAASEFQFAASAALATWNAAESSAWNDYLIVIGNNLPEERITAPPRPLPALDPPPQLQPGQRDPGQMLAMAQPANEHLDGILLRHFNNWTQGDDHLTLNRLNSLINNENTSAAETAALVALKYYVLQNGGGSGQLGFYATGNNSVFGTVGRIDNIPQLTRANIERFQALRAGTANPAEPTLTQHARNLDALFVRMRASASALRNDVFPQAATSEQLANAITQGILGDCSFLSALINLVRATDVNQLRSRIRPGQGGGYEVRLYNLRAGEWQWIWVATPTPSQRLLYGQANNGYLWVSLFEAAYLQLVIRETSRPNAFRVLQNSSYYEGIVNGEEMTRSIRRLLGPDARQPASYVIANLNNDNELIRNLSTQRTRHIVSVSTRGDLPLAALNAGLVPNHAYAVVRWDATMQRVILRNPWNNPNVPGGVEVRVSLADLRAWFNNLATDAWIVAQTP